MECMILKLPWVNENINAFTLNLGILTLVLRPLKSLFDIAD